jgi:hypothetical protein
VKATGTNFDYEADSLTLAPDDAKLSGMKPSSFKIERRAGIEHQLTQYFSLAPLRTDDHLALIERWESSI